MRNALADLGVAVDEDRELVAADAEDVIRRADGRERAPRDLAQHLVARLVAGVVVDLLESVEVEQRERGGPARTREHQLEPLVERAAVAGAGQWIATRLGERVDRAAQASHRDGGQVGDRREQALRPRRCALGDADEQNAEPVVADHERQRDLTQMIAARRGADRQPAREGLLGETRMRGSRRGRAATALELQLPVLAEDVRLGKGDVADVDEGVGNPSRHLGRLRRARQNVRQTHLSLTALGSCPRANRVLPLSDDGANPRPREPASPVRVRPSESLASTRPCRRRGWSVLRSPEAS